MATKKKRTNLDMIRKMGAEDFAEVLARYCASRYRCENCVFCNNCPEDATRQAWEEWLNKEYPFPWVPDFT